VALSEKDFGYRLSRYIEIENIGVSSRYRSKGIGKLLLQKTEEWVKKQKATKLYVSAYWNNGKAIRFYKENGFSEIGIELEKNI
jgi:ribosomal protein S18 acetylase RimI-like enzyme